MELVLQIKIDHSQCEQLEEPFSVKFFDPAVNLDENRSFVYFQLIVHFLTNSQLTIEERNEHLKELIRLAKVEYLENHHQMNIVHDFDRDYLSMNTSKWFSSDSFLYKILNKSLNRLHLDRLYLLQFFIDDFLRQCQENPCSSSEICVYRSTLLTISEYEEFSRSIGFYLSFHRFFYASFNRQHAIDLFLNYKFDERQVKPVIFKIEANTKLDRIKPLATFNSIQTNDDHEDILFPFGSLFNLIKIEQESDGITMIHLNLCSEEEPALKCVFDRIQHYYGENQISLLSFAKILRRMGKFDEAEQVYHRLLSDSISDQDLISCAYHYLGRIAQIKGDFMLSVEHLQKSLEIKMKIFEPFHPKLAHSHNCLGLVYQQEGKHEKAVEHFHQAMLIWRRVYGPNHPNVAGCYNNLGVVYKRQKKYRKALGAFQQALDIRERNPATAQHDLAGSHNNLGAVYVRLGHYDLALEHYNLSLKIKSKILSPNHTSIGSTLENMAYVYELRAAFSQALPYLEKAAQIYRQTLPSNHQAILQITDSIQRVSSRVK